MITDYQIISPSKEHKAAVTIVGSVDDLETIYLFFESSKAAAVGVHEFPPHAVEKFLKALRQACYALHDRNGCP